MGKHTAHPASPPATPVRHMYSKLCLSRFFLCGATASSSVGQMANSLLRAASAWPICRGLLLSIAGGAALFIRAKGIPPRRTGSRGIICSGRGGVLSSGCENTAEEGGQN